MDWLRRARSGEFDFVVCSHTLAEVYAVVTRLPLSPRVTPGAAWRLIRENIEKIARIMALSAADYRSVIKDMSERGLSGGAAYDALIAKAAQKAGVEKVLTLNPDHFHRVWAEGADRIHVP